MVCNKHARAGLFIASVDLMQEEPKPETKAQPEGNATAQGKPEDMDAEPSQAAPEASTEEPMEH